jgi:hypothetical protein
MSKFVVVTTQWRGVFAGTLVSQNESLGKIVLSNARCAMRWGTTDGFFELASKGPNSKSKLGAIAPEATLYGVTSFLVCTAEAEAAWKN